MFDETSHYNRLSSDSDEERKHFLKDHGGFVPLETHVKQRKRYQRMIIAHWVVALILILITIPMFSRNTMNYWIPNEIYCILFP